MFNLRIRITRGALDSLKASLSRALPHVKSSHRVEAAARGLGFKTYASMRSIAEAGPSNPAEIDWHAFTAYLAAHDFEVPADPLYHAAAYVAIKTVQDRMPRLTSHGMGISPMRTITGQQISEALAQHRAKFLKARDELSDEYHVRQFLSSLAFLSCVPPIKTISESNSYWVKHIAENFPCTYPNGRSLGPVYVTNGALIAAAVHLGFSTRDYYDSMNVSFNMSKRVLLDLDCQFRPDGAHAQARRAREEALATRRRYR